MPLKPLFLAVCFLLALLRLAATPIHADTAFMNPAEPHSKGIEEADIDGMENRETKGGPAPESNAAALQTREPKDTFERPDYKSHVTAYAWSILGTAAPLFLASQLSALPENGTGGLTSSLILGGLLIGPSLGQFYAGSPAGGFLGFGIRSAGGFMTMLGFAQMLGDAFCMDTEEKTCNDGDGGGALMIVGTVTYVGGTLYSLIDAGRAVERHNDRQNLSRVFGWSPTIAPGAQGGLRTGALAWMRF